MNPKQLLHIANVARSISGNSAGRPLAVAFAEKFFWQIFLTNEWNHVFQSEAAPKFPIMPRQLSFVPTLVVWRDDRQMEGDDKLVIYTEDAIKAIAILGMRRALDAGAEFWYPNSASFVVPILDKQEAAACGKSKLVTPAIKVWYRDDQNH